MSRTTQIIAVLFVLIAGFTLWNMFASDTEVATLSSEIVSDTSVGDARVLDTLNNMKNLRLDGRLFETPAFQALVNTERQIVPEPVGRQNPFSPVGADEDVLMQTTQQGDVNPQDGSLVE